MRPALIWVALAALVAVPVALAAVSPWLAYRGFAYITGGFAGIFALCILLVQPLLAAGYLPGLRGPKGRLWHRRAGIALVTLTALHVAGLWITSPPDTVDALLLRSPTPFSVWGFISLWGIAATALLVALRRKLPPRRWRWAHNALAALAVLATVLHAVQIEGAMELISKWTLCIAALAATTAALIDLRLLRR
ncbi:ferric reductase-like transmembrane domain-containing protein [Vannielia litorea]|uniref:ferric reductase-like transmembrane domain-containing protein n=1 Tax=Vannielia litorea TaxID=1217970 RepID=UPI001C947CA1|nr:ferric reductase-like transmembrane domain-containing protein [Vannielia litorea]MBY6152084.1 ferric reductase-like transmembrane domain-containing protein [Vannielia litorea]